MRFSERFELTNHYQSNFDFANIRIDRDNKLFIDPTRIAVEDGDWFQNCNQIIQDFFNTIFDLYSEGHTESARAYLQSSGESNEIFLGYTAEGFPKGTGNSEESLAKVFSFVHEQGLLDDDIVGRIEDFYVFVPSFGPDLLSDLVASLIKAELIAFTQKQCENYNIPLTIQITKQYWNHITHEWETIVEMVPEINGYPIVLIPKQILVKKYLYSSERYWNQVVSVWRQERHRDENSTLHQNRPEKREFASKDDIYKAETEELGVSEKKQYLVNMTRENREMIVQFRNNINNTQRGTNSNKMSDEELDIFIEESFEPVETIDE